MHLINERRVHEAEAEGPRHVTMVCYQVQTFWGRSQICIADCSGQLALIHLDGILVFLQIFEFLDQDGLGRLNLVALMSVMPEWLDDLDDEVS